MLVSHQRAENVTASIEAENLSLLPTPDAGAPRARAGSPQESSPLHFAAIIASHTRKAKQMQSPERSKSDDTRSFIENRLDCEHTSRMRAARIHDASEPNDEDAGVNAFAPVTPNVSFQQSAEADSTQSPMQDVISTQTTVPSPETILMPYLSPTAQSSQTEMSPDTTDAVSFSDVHTSHVYDGRHSAVETTAETAQELDGAPKQFFGVEPQEAALQATDITDDNVPRQVTDDANQVQHATEQPDTTSTKNSVRYTEPSASRLSEPQQENQVSVERMDPLTGASSAAELSGRSQGEASNDSPGESDPSDSMDTERIRSTAHGRTETGHIDIISRTDVSAETLLTYAASSTGASDSHQVHHLDAGDLIDFIAARVKVELTAGKRELTLRLDPPDLGQVRIAVSSDAGRIITRLEVTSVAVRDLLQSNLEHLQHSLRKIDLGVGECCVSLTTDSGSGQNAAWIPMTVHDDGKRAQRLADPQESFHFLNMRARNPRAVLDYFA